MGTICPYCNVEVDEIGIEFEDGCCPECGSAITLPAENEDGPAVFEEDEDFFGDIEFEDEVNY